MQTHTAVALLFVSLLGIACQAPYRNPEMRAAYYREHACPSTGAHSGPCPGHQVDHIKPLCGGGKDSPENMQWLSVEDHKQKTKLDVAACKSH